MNIIADYVDNPGATNSFNHKPSFLRALSAVLAYFSQPRFLKYHIGTSALATIRLTV